jgi:hypothetical protein
MAGNKQQEQEEVYSVVLNADSEKEKTVYLRKWKIKYKGQCMKSALSRAGGDKDHALSVLDEEMLKMLLVSINNKELGASDKEDLDELFEPAEFYSLMQILPDITGMPAEGVAAPQVKIAFTGKQ